MQIQSLCRRALSDHIANCFSIEACEAFDSYLRFITDKLNQVGHQDLAVARIWPKESIIVAYAVRRYLKSDMKTMTNFANFAKTTKKSGIVRSVDERSVRKITMIMKGCVENAGTTS